MEKVKGLEMAICPSDMWSFGCLILEVMSKGTKEWESDPHTYSKDHILQTITHHHPHLTEKKCAYVLETIVDVCLCIDIEKRATANQVKKYMKMIFYFNLKTFQRSVN